MDSLNIASGALTATSWLLEVAGAASAATTFGVAGAVIGIVALTGAIIIDLTTPGPIAVLKAYVGCIADDEEGARFPIELDDVGKHIDLVNKEDGFDDFQLLNGRPHIDPYRTSPTLYGAMRLGFSHLEIAKLFDKSSAYVEGVLPKPKELA